MEGVPGFEPGNKGFADLCLTTWLYSHYVKQLVGTTGFEPATSPTPRVRATELRHVPIYTHTSIYAKQMLSMILCKKVF